MCRQKGPHYDAGSVVSAVKYFKAAANGFVDLAFLPEDARQIAALENWLNPGSFTIVYRRLIDEYRRVGILKRSFKGINPHFVEDHVGQLPDSGKDFRLLHELVSSINSHKTKYPELEEFVILFYVEEKTRAEVAKHFGISSRRVTALIKKTESIAKSLVA